ncbi:MAG TPA: cytochrome c oxidase subunit 3 [Chitinophagaceae bacterium]|nr:cytochrome c oxidase subunit 3 [Chitinophagaceae bacterium]
MSSIALEKESSKVVWGGGRSPFNLSYGKIMMWYFLMSDAFTFGAFLISYGTTRFFSALWPDANSVFKSFPFFPDTANLPLMFVSLMTFILIVSSVTMVLAVHAGHCRDKAGVIKWMIWTIIGGIAFLSCQAWEWNHLHHHGAWWGSFLNGADAERLPHFFKHDTAPALLAAEGANAANKFFNFFFTITGFHGAHVASGVVLNIIILLNTINGTYERRGHYEMVEKVGLYWHFVDLVWVFVFTCFYLL